MTPFSRRGFLSAAGLIAGSVASQSVSASSPLSAPIAKLPRMDGLVGPVTEDERLERIDRVRRLMTAQQVDALAIGQPASVRYLAGLESRQDAPLVLVVPRIRAPFLVPSRPWDEPAGIVLSRGLKACGLATGVIGIDHAVDASLLDELALDMPALRLGVTSIVDEVRARKDAHEVALLRTAAQATLLAYAAVTESLVPGMRSTEMSRLAIAAFDRMGLSGTVSVRIGRATAHPTGMLTPAELQANDLVTLEGGASLDGYQPDLARTITIGDVGPMAAKLREAAADALARLRRSLRPGREFNEVHATAAQPLDRAAKRAGRSVFSRLITHGIGLDGYEWPYRDDRPIDLLAGMVLSGEPGLYARNQYGVQHTLLFHLTEDGAELLTPAADLSEMPTA